MQVKEQNKLIECLGRFQALMLKKMFKKGRQGHSGWDRKENAGYMQRQLTEHAKKGDYLDCANIAMFLWNLEQ